MPLDSHSYLVSQGWSGKGFGLRPGAVTRPLSIPPKRTLAGLGKDRDDAFPFWDHLFSAAAKSVHIKLSHSDEEGTDSEETNSNGADTVRLERTTTGILSNRRPMTGSPATSRSRTGLLTAHEDSKSPSRLIVTAKREAARHALYSRMLRGPILGSNECQDIDQEWWRNAPVARPPPGDAEIDVKGKKRSTRPSLDAHDPNQQRRKGRRKRKRKNKEMETLK